MDQLGVLGEKVTIGFRKKLTQELDKMGKTFDYRKFLVI